MFVLESATVREALEASFAERTEHDFGGVRMVGRHHLEGDRLVSDLEVDDGTGVRGLTIEQLSLPSARIAELVEAVGLQVDELLGDLTGAPFDTFGALAAHGRPPPVMSDDRLGWVREAHAAIARAAGDLSDEQLAEPSLLPGWTRAHVLAHIARNADGLRNLVTWAETGVETPMYTSFETRDADIEASAAQAPDELRADVVAADEALLAALDALSDDASTVTVKALLGDPFPARDLPWVRRGRRGSTWSTSTPA